MQLASQGEKTEGMSITRLLGYVATFMLIGAIVYALINGVLAASLGFQGGVPEVDLEASLVVGIIAILLLMAIAVYRRLNR
jgi:NhaP-type Na+/H+ or K+/H+ antiporter